MHNYLKKIKGNFYWASFAFFFTFLQQYGFEFFKGLPLSRLPLKAFFITFAFYFIFSFIKNSILRSAVTSFIMIMAYFQLAHISFYGTQILPIEIWLFFTESSEIFGTLRVDFIHILIPLFFTLPLVIIIFYLGQKVQTASIPYIQFAFFLYLIFNPVRTYLTGNTWGHRPSQEELYGVNTYLSVSYFFGKILPFKLSGTQSEGQESYLSDGLLFKTNKNSFIENIILVLGESLTPNHMSLFGYDRNTTPYLDSLKEGPDLFYKKSFSAGVSTDVSLAFLMNVTYGGNGLNFISRGERCLFKKAKEQSYTTYFYSIQAGHELRYIIPYLCPNSIDEYRALEDIAPEIQDHNEAPDIALIPKLESILKDDGKKFITLHMRGSHSPYSLRSLPRSKRFSNGKSSRIDEYDNSVVEFDYFFKELLEITKMYSNNTLIVYVSDHGQGLGEEGVWGNGQLAKSSYIVPFLIYGKDAKEMGKRSLNEKFITSFNIGLFIYELMGLETSLKPNQVIHDFEIYGRDLDGLAGKIKAFSINTSDARRD